MALEMQSPRRLPTEGLIVIQSFGREILRPNWRSLSSQKVGLVFQRGCRDVPKWPNRPIFAFELHIKVAGTLRRERRSTEKETF